MTHNLSFCNTLTSKKFRKYGLMLSWPMVRAVKKKKATTENISQQKEKQVSRGRAMNNEASGKVRFYSYL
jgi:hypothetical protein